MLPRVLFCQLELTQGMVLYVSVCTLIRIILGFTSFSMLIIVTDLKENGKLFCEIRGLIGSIFYHFQTDTMGSPATIFKSHLFCAYSQI